MHAHKPPINLRSTEALLEIVGAEEDWNPDAVEEAKAELRRRNIPNDRLMHAKYLRRKSDDIEALKRAQASYSVLDFLLKPAKTIVEILFTWELKKDGYLRKARQQRWLRLILIILILFFVLHQL